MSIKKDFFLDKLLSSVEILQKIKAEKKQEIVQKEKQVAEIEEFIASLLKEMEEKQKEDSSEKSESLKDVLFEEMMKGISELKKEDMKPGSIHKMESFSGGIASVTMDEIKDGTYVPTEREGEKKVWCSVCEEYHEAEEGTHPF
jgi:formate dehydrogenase maturation protein FdhE